MSSSQWEEKHLSSSGDGDQGETMNTQTSGTDSDASPQSSSSPHRATTIRSRMNTDKKSIERFHRHRGTNSRGDASSLPSPHTLAHETSPSVGPTYPTDSTLADKPAPDAPMDMDETERARLESMDETPMDESEAAPANPHPGDASVVTMSTASTKPNAFDIALGRSEDFQPSATLEEALGGPVWESAVADSQPTPVPAVATRTTPVVPPTDASVATMSTVSTKPNAFDVALARSGDVQGTDDTTEEATGGPVWESAVTSTIPTPVPEVARRSAQGRVAHQTTDISVATVSTASTKTNAFDIAFSRSADYQPPTETEDAAAGGPVWESAVSSSKPAPVPEVAKIASRFQPTDVSVATMSTVSTKPNAFDVALSRSEEAHEAANNEEETGGPVWESAVTSAKPTPVPEVAKMSSKVQTPSKPTDSSVASMSTVSTKPNAFDIALSRSTDFQSSSENKDDVAGGPVWESAVTSTKPTPVPEVAKMSSAKDKKSSPQVGGDEKQGGSVATASTHPNAFDVAVTRSADFNPSDNMDGVEGGRVWKKAVSSSKPPPVPMVARISHSRKDERSRPAWVRDTESCDGTASTLTGTNAFDTAMSMADIQTVQDSIKDEDGGPMWELAATSTEPEPLPMVAQTVPAVSVQASQPCEDSCDATRSTNTGTNAFDKALANSTDYSPMEYTDLDDEGGRMWGLAAPSTDSTPHGVAAMVRAIEANARTTPSDTTPEEIYDEPDSTPSDETSLSCEMSSTTPGASKFEKLRAPTPDACDVAPPKSEDMSEVFLDEEQLSTRQSSKKHDHKKKSHSKSKTTDAQSKCGRIPFSCLVLSSGHLTRVVQFFRNKWQTGKISPRRRSQ